MAPPHTLPRRTSTLSRRPKSTRPNLTHRTTSSSPFTTTKKDKRLIKRSSFLSQVQGSSHAITKSKKRRRQSKKLATDLHSLGDALPEAAGISEAGDEVQGGRSDVMRLKKSLKSRPGAMKKREKVVKGERERFEKNLAGMLALGNAGEQQEGEDTQDGGAVMDRWKALRAHLEKGRTQTDP